MKRIGKKDYMPGRPPYWRRNWRAIWRHQLYSDKFKAIVNDYLDNVGRRGAAGAAEFGGFMRRLRQRAKLNLARDMMDELTITPTIHVAKKVMQSAFFGEAVDNNMLEDWFAGYGRTSKLDDRVMPDARIKVRARPLVSVYYGALYRWYLRALDRRIKEIRVERILKRIF